jgi:hypothetical protein
MVPGIKVLVVLAAVISALAIARADIDLTPDRTVRELDGCKFPQLEFRDGGRKITYEAPAGWEAIARDSQTLALVPPNKDMVSAKIKFMPTPGTLVLDEAQLKHFKDTASQLLPPESRIMIEPTVTPNPLLMNDHPTCEIDILFVLHSQRLRTSVLFVDLGESQLRFSLIARAGDFDALHQAFQESWYTWQWIGVSNAPTPRINVALAGRQR